MRKRLVQWRDQNIFRSGGRIPKSNVRLREVDVTGTLKSREAEKLHVQSFVSKTAKPARNRMSNVFRTVVNVNTTGWIKYTRLHHRSNIHKAFKHTSLISQHYVFTSDQNNAHALDRHQPHSFRRHSITHILRHHSPRLTASLTFAAQRQVALLSRFSYLPAGRCHF